MKKRIFLILFATVMLTVGEIYANEDFFIPNKCRTFDTTYYNKKRKLANDFQEKKLMQTFVISPQKRFRVHYDTVETVEGNEVINNTVDLTDKDKNGIPDYIDSVCAIFDYVYEIEVVKMGMNRPRTDYYDANDSLYDIYVLELGLEYPPTYGFTSRLLNNYDKYKSYSDISIDNNYSPEDKYEDLEGKTRKSYNTTGINGLKVTAAHEFHHAIQFAYGDNEKCASIYEMSAVCMELLVYPEIEDYLMYVNAMMANINRFNFGANENENYENCGYSFGIFFYMITKKYGNDAIKKYWEIVEKGTYCYEAFEELFAFYDSNLEKEWNEFLGWIYYSGENSIEEKYFYPISKRFNPLIPKANYKEPTLDANMLTPYELTYSRFINSSNSNFIAADTIDIIFTNTDTKGVIARSKHEPYNSIECTALTSRNEIADGEEIVDNYWLKIFSLSENMKYLLNLKAGGPIFSVSSAFPQPFEKNKNEYLFFPISDEVVLGEKLDLTIYDANLKFVASETLEATVASGKRVIKYQPESLDAGIYTYTVGRSVVHSVGKFAVK